MRRNDASTDVWLAKDEALALIGVGHRTLQKKAKDGQVGRRKMGTQTVYNRADILRVIEAREAPSVAIAPTTPVVSRPAAPESAGYGSVILDALVATLRGIRAAPAPREWLTLDEAEVACGLPAKFLHRLITRGTLPALDVGGKRRDWRVARRDLAALDARGRNTANSLASRPL